LRVVVYNHDSSDSLDIERNYRAKVTLNYDAQTSTSSISWDMAPVRLQVDLAEFETVKSTAEAAQTTANNALAPENYFNEITTIGNAAVANAKNNLKLRNFYSDGSSATFVCYGCYYDGVNFIATAADCSILVVDSTIQLHRSTGVVTIGLPVEGFEAIYDMASIGDALTAANAADDRAQGAQAAANDADDRAQGAQSTADNAMEQKLSKDLTGLTMVELAYIKDEITADCLTGVIDDPNPTMSNDLNANNNSITNVNNLQTSSLDISTDQGRIDLLTQLPDFIKCKRELFMFEDFLHFGGGGEMQFITANSGGTAAIIANTDANRIGVCAISVTGTGSGDRGAIHTGSPNSTPPIVLGSINIRLGCAFAPHYNLFSATYPGTILIGLASNITNPSAGVFLRSVNGGNFFAVSRKADSETVTDTGISPAVGAWIKYEAEINTAADTVEHYLNGDLVETHTTDIPDGVGLSNILSCSRTAVPPDSKNIGIAYDWYYNRFKFQTDRY